ncbi:class I SAM-dependent methyltransferase [Dyadobacter subterraneus]|uniref:Methyltransferase domain-containing protein n=1 Tax=Dyadobacter subterraneus TaxID=2773304 RepID=A0ABR9WGE2_9BACT|nr:class I SAM-dependent methyltransferase [Dyadobacter subterraneus]MBE9463219.1 methyltransferase domain-containing protein [Dyadobacter subterraneus]
MNKEWSEEELKEMAQQLANPHGSEGVKTGERMSHGNGQMIHRTIDLLEIKANDYVLEIGPGKGAHVSSIIELAENIKYQGIDISETMVAESSELNENLISAGSVAFALSNGNTIEFPDNSFDKIFTVNTVYFWENPLVYSTEIFRILKPGGTFALSFSDSTFMKQLPFTKFGFTLYNKAEAENLLIDAHFKIEKTIEELEVTKRNLGEEVERPVVIVFAKK